MLKLAAPVCRVLVPCALIGASMTSNAHAAGPDSEKSAAPLPHGSDSAQQNRRIGETFRRSLHRRYKWA